MRCFKARQCASPGLDIYLHCLFTVKVISGRVQQATKLAKAIRLRYSVQMVGPAGGSGQSRLVKSIPDWQGVGQGLQSRIFARSNSELIEFACEMNIRLATGHIECPFPGSYPCPCINMKSSTQIMTAVRSLRLGFRKRHLSAVAGNHPMSASKVS